MATTRSVYQTAMWQTIATAPLDRDIELAVIDGSDIHALVFPCRRVGDGWINALTYAQIDVHPTHWRAWADQPDRPDFSL